MQSQSVRSKALNFFINSLPEQVWIRPKPYSLLFSLGVLSIGIAPTQEYVSSCTRNGGQGLVVSPGQGIPYKFDTFIRFAI